MAQSTKRTCGPCMACCKPFLVKEVGKHDINWCPQCTVGKGCNIYNKRPFACRLFKCLWICGEENENDRPDLLGVMMTIEYVILGAKELFILHLWEMENGAFDNARARQIAESAMKQKRAVIYHKPVSDTQFECTLRAASGLLNESELETLYEKITS